MKTKLPDIKSVPTNIITGFLGVGKTSAILNLLESKPKQERWAVLVNEFGEIGIDGSLFQGQHLDENSVFIREVPGGCMCCAAGLPMQISLNQLLIKARPDRLLIEPTGLGHPFEVLEVLSANEYRGVLALQKTITLVDARKVNDERYYGHDTFKQQVALADVVVGNKEDLYRDGDKARLQTFVEKHNSLNATTIFSSMGKFPIEILSGDTAAIKVSTHHHNHHSQAEPVTLASELPIPVAGYLKATNDGEGFHSIGWRFSPDNVFDRIKLEAFLSGITAERVKAVFITQDGVFAYNISDNDVLTEIELDEADESKMEVIALETNNQDQWNEELIDCLVSDSQVSG